MVREHDQLQGLVRRGPVQGAGGVGERPGRGVRPWSQAVVLDGLGAGQVDLGDPENGEYRGGAQNYGHHDESYRRDHRSPPGTFLYSRAAHCRVRVSVLP